MEHLIATEQETMLVGLWEGMVLGLFLLKKNVYTICKIFYTEDISITEEEMYGT